MYLVQTVRCHLRWHVWGTIHGDNWGAYRTCTYCGKSKRVGPNPPPDAHDHLGLHH